MSLGAVRLLIVEDEADLAEPLAQGLRQQGYAVDVALSGPEGCLRLEDGEYDLLILDLNLPGMDGLEIARRARVSQPELLILMLTARAALDDLVSGLDVGADDYLVKPFHFRELSARIRALLRRDLRARQPMLRIGDLVLDPAGMVARQGGKRLELTRKEFAILHYLMRHPGEVISQEDLLEHVWDEQADPLTNVVRVHINSLRRALDDDVRDPRYIRTEIGRGYVLVAGHCPDDVA